MGGIIRGDVVESTDVMVPEQSNEPAPQVTEQEQPAEPADQEEEENKKEG
jgi:hypothetical protein